MALLNHLAESHIRTRVQKARRNAEVDAILELDVDNTELRFAVESRDRAPYPNELATLDQLFRRASELGLPLLHAPYISEGLGRALTNRGWSWADDAGNYRLRARGLDIARRTPSMRQKPRRRLPQGRGALAIIRFLIVHGDESQFGPTELGRIAGVSQARASQVLARLTESRLTDRRRRDWYAPDRERLLHAFLEEYRGPGGSEFALYTLDPLHKIAINIASRAGHKASVALSADVGPDLVAPWRKPTTLIVYLDHPVKIPAMGLTEAQSRHDANVLLRFPSDTSLFALKHPLTASVEGVEVTLADPTQMIWDLHDLGGDDRVEAAGHVKSWLLKSR